MPESSDISAWRSFCHQCHLELATASRAEVQCQVREVPGCQGSSTEHQGLRNVQVVVWQQVTSGQAWGGCARALSRRIAAAAGCLYFQLYSVVRTKVIASCQFRSSVACCCISEVELWFWILLLRDVLWDQACCLNQTAEWMPVQGLLSMHLAGKVFLSFLRARLWRGGLSLLPRSGSTERYRTRVSLPVLAVPAGTWQERSNSGGWDRVETEQFLPSEVPVS